jgi:hypothetical protein
MSSSDRLRQAVALAREGRRVEARDLLLVLADEDPQNELVWIWLTGLVDSFEDKIIACENVLTINPSNERVRTYLRQLLAQQDEPDPFREQIKAAPRDAPVVESISPSPESLPGTLPGSGDLREQARQFEHEGRFGEALDAYRNLASQTRDSREFDRIYKEITRLESLQQEKIRYVAPSTSIARMAFGWPILYLSLIFIQAGGKFFSYPAWYLWLGVPFVAFGSYLIALSEVNARHPIWKALFAEKNSTGSAFARFMAGALGWLLILTPHLILIGDSLLRMRDFQIPPYPF